MTSDADNLWDASLSSLDASPCCPRCGVLLRHVGAPCAFCGLNDTQPVENRPLRRAVADLDRIAAGLDAVVDREDDEAEGWVAI